MVRVAGPDFKGIFEVLVKRQVRSQCHFMKNFCLERSRRCCNIVYTDCSRVTLFGLVRVAVPDFKGVFEVW